MKRKPAKKKAAKKSTARKPAARTIAHSPAGDAYGHGCVNMECRLRKGGCTGFEGCPGYKKPRHRQS